MPDETDSDGFTTVEVSRRASRLLEPTIVFFAASASVFVPEQCLDCARADWAWHGTTVRLRLGDQGRFKLTHNSNNTRGLSAASLYNALGRGLRGRFRPTVDGCDLTIDISAPEETPQ